MSTSLCSAAHRLVAAMAIAALLAEGALLATEAPEEKAHHEDVAATALATAVQWRGLDGDEQVTIERLSRNAFDRMRQNELTLSQVGNRELALRAFGFLDPTVGLTAIERALRTSDLSGFFHAPSGGLVFVDERTSRTEPDWHLKALTLHEMTHHLQVRHFGTFDNPEPTASISDRRLALASLVDGDATYVISASWGGIHPEQVPIFDSLQSSTFENPSGRFTLSAGKVGDIDGGPAPSYVLGEMTFPYHFGLLFVTGVRRAGGQPLLDHAFENPPTSTEQILHPEKWIAADDPPIMLALPDLSKPLGAPSVASGSWGEAGIRLGLAARGPGIGTGRRLAAAAGWGGDAFAVYGHGHDESVVWLSHWDSISDAEEFTALIGEVFDTWQVEQRGVRVVAATLPSTSRRVPATFESIADALFRVEGTLPAVAGATLAADPANRLPVLSMEQYAEFLGNSAPAGEATDTIVRTTPSSGADVGLEAGESNSALREQLRASKQPTSFIEDGHLHVPNIGFELPLAGWRVLHKPTDGTLIDPIVVLNDPFATVCVVAWSPMPPQAPLAAMASGIARGAEDYREIDRTHVTTPREHLELVYTTDVDSVAHRVRHRMMRTERGVLTIQIMTAASNWTDRHDANSDKLFDAIQWSEISTTEGAVR